MNKDRSYKYFMVALNEWLSQKGNNRSTLAEKCDCTRGHITQQLNKKSGMAANFDTQLKIAKACGYDYFEFLKLGKFILDPTPSQDQSIIVKAQTPKVQEFLEENTTNYRSVPLYESGRLAAWSNGAAFDQYEEATSQVIVYLPELAHPANHKLIAAKVGGDSMEPLIPEGSIVIIDRDDREFADDKIFALALDEGGVTTIAVKTVRKFEKVKRFALWSENRAYPPKLVVESDWLRLCVGRVIWMWRSFEKIK